MSYSWVSNQAKVDRAILELKKLNQPATEEAIKALYVKYGGLVLETPVVEVEEEVVIPRRGKK